MSGDWQPIETAPKDGTRIDLFYPLPCGRKADCVWHEIFGWGWREPEYDGERVLPEEEWCFHCYPNMDPTHWMPAPNPPAPSPASVAASTGDRM